jgi:hypothetical protein
MVALRWLPLPAPAGDVLNVGRTIPTLMRIDMGFKQQGALYCLGLSTFRDLAEAKVIFL